MQQEQQEQQITFPPTSYLTPPRQQRKTLKCPPAPKANRCVQHNNTPPVVMNIYNL